MKIVKTILRLEKYISKPKQLAKKISNWLSTSRKANWPKPDSKNDFNFSQVCSHDLKAYKLFWKFILDSFIAEEERLFADKIQNFRISKNFLPYDLRIVLILWAIYLKKGRNYKSFCTTAISVKRNAKVSEFIKIGPIILVEKACRSSVF